MARISRYRSLIGLLACLFRDVHTKQLVLDVRVQDFHSRIFIQQRIVYSFFETRQRVSKANGRAKITDQSARGTRSGGSRESPTPSSRKSILASTLLKSCLRFTFAAAVVSSLTSGRVKSHPPASHHFGSKTNR